MAGGKGGRLRTAYQDQPRYPVRCFFMRSLLFRFGWIGRAVCQCYFPWYFPLFKFDKAYPGVYMVLSSASASARLKVSVRE